MKLKRILTVTVCTVLMLSLCVGCGNKADSSKGNDDVKKVEKLSDAKLLGRTYRSDDGSLWLGLSGTGAEFEFTGDKLSVVLKGSAADADNAARVGIFVDANRASDVCLDAAEKTVDISSTYISAAAMTEKSATDPSTERRRRKSGTRRTP